MTLPYPERPIRYIVPFGRGPTEMQARSLASALAARLGQPLIVENHPGASGMTGTALVARAAADGYTLLAANPGPLTVGPHIHAAPYDALRDFEPIVLIATLPSVIAVHPQFEARSIRSLAAAARAKPGALRFGSPGAGTVGHLASALFQHLAQVRFTHVPCAGLPAAIEALLERRVDAVVIPMSDARPLARDGRIRALAATTRVRAAAWPELPTVAEEGPGDFESFNWNGVAAPAGTPREIVERVNEAVNDVLETSEVGTELVANGYELAGGSPERFGAFLAMETTKWRDVAQRAGLAPGHSVHAAKNSRNDEEKAWQSSS